MKRLFRIPSFSCPGLFRRLRSSKRCTLPGDTLIEVMFSVGIFGLVAVGAISVMNRGLYTAQGTLETTMARSEIDTQAEALRFIHEAYVSKKNASSNQYKELWQTLTSTGYGGYMHAPDDYSFAKFRAIYQAIAQGGGVIDGTSYTTCDDLYSEDTLPKKAFVVNPSELQSADSSKILVAPAQLEPTGVYPRLNYLSTTGTLSDATSGAAGLTTTERTLQTADGIIVLAAQSNDGIECDPSEDDPTDDGWRPDFYDFYIYTCWDSPGTSAPKTISTTIRLYNSDQITLQIGQDISFSGGNFAFAVDTTGSMGGLINAYKAEAARAASEVLQKGGNVTIYDFNDPSFQMLCGFDNCSLDNITSVINQLYAGRLGNGGDGPERPLKAARDMLDRFSWDGGGVIVFLTDASYHDPDGSDTTNSIMSEALSRNIKIHALLPLGSEYESYYDGYTQWYQLTEGTGGTVYSTNIDREILDQIVDSLPTKTVSNCHKTTKEYVDPFLPEITPIEYFTILFDPNDGSGDKETSQLGTIGGDPFSLTENPFSRSGYEFTGWNTKADGTGTAYSDKATVSDSILGLSANDKLTLYAQWKRISNCDDITEMQNWGDADTLGEHETTQLCDRRDGKVYPVIKLKDGHVWIQQNLQLVFNELKEDISKANTNNPSDAFIELAAKHPAANNTEKYSELTYATANSRIAYVNDPYYGGTQYNWPTAMAFTLKASDVNRNAPGDICPSGWHVPTMREWVKMTYSEDPKYFFNYWTPDMYYESNLARLPLNFKQYPIGLYMPLGVKDPVCEIIWLSTTTSDTGSAYGADPSGGSDIRLGNAIRCISN